MRKILVPTDFSNQATFALDLACEMAKKEETEITLVHVVEISKRGSSFLGGTSINTEATLSGEDPMEKIFIMKLIQKREEQFATLLQDPKYKGVKIVDKLMKGTPYHAIEEIISEIKTDLIIMGTTGADSWEESLIGTTAEKVVRHSSCPVFTLRNRVHAKDINHIVLASDFKDDLEGFKTVPIMLQKFFDAKLHLLFVNTPSHFTNEREVLKEMDDFTAKNNLGSIEKHIYNHKNPGEGILFFAQDYKMDLLIMSTSGERNSFLKLFDHSIAEDVVNHSQKPVVTLNIGKFQK